MESSPRRDRAQSGFYRAFGKYLERSGVQVGYKIPSFLGLLGIFFTEEVFVQPYFRPNGVSHGHPMDCRLYLSTVGGTSPSGFRVISAPKFEYLSGSWVLYDFFTLYEKGITKTHLSSRCKPEKFLWRLFHEIVLFNVQLPGKGYLPCSLVGILGIEYPLEFFGFSLRIVGNYHFERTKHPHISRYCFVEIFPDTILE